MSNLQVANTIVQQLGGNRFRAMTGANTFVGSERSVTFKIGRNAKGVSHVRITLNVADLYDMEFLSVRGTSIKRKSDAIARYADQLRETFEQHTGLYTSL